VFITPGNHDPWSETSYLWSARLLKARGWAWPGNVHIFTSAGWSPVTIPNLSNVRVWGRCFTSNAVSTSRPLEEGSIILPSSADAQGLEVAIFHGSNEANCPPGQTITAPFSEKEINYSPFGYHAVGHYHTPSRIEHRGDTVTSTTGRGVSGAASAGVRLAYAGSGVALDLTESGLHGALEVRIEYGFRQPFVEIEFVELDRRRVYDVICDIGGASSAEQIDRRVQKTLDDAGVTENDIATLRLKGRLVKGVRYSGPGADVRQRAFHLKLDLRTVRPDYDLEAYMMKGPTTTEERFACALLQRLVEERDPARRAAIESAIYYGLDAFRLREVVPSYEEFGA